MSEFWLISAPGEKTCQQTWEVMNNLTSKQNDCSANYKFHIPDLKVGTLDVLVGLSDELGKLDTFGEAVTRKVSHYLNDVLEGQKDKVAENLQVNGMDPATYLMRFQWDMAKYPIKQPLKSIADSVAKQLSQIDTDLKQRAQQYNNLKGSLEANKRKNTGSLLSRNIADLVKKEDFILNSEYLTTLAVVVAKPMYKEWYNKYEALTDMVVPRSTVLIYEDQDNGLFTVSLFRKVVDDYKLKCREHRFITRDFAYNEEVVNAERNEMSKLESDQKKLFGPLVRWLKVNFSEAFTGWIHIKALRVFVESVLRYGLPVNFQAMLLRPKKKSHKRLLDILMQLYNHLDNSGTSVGHAEVIDIPGLNMSASEYYPFVYYKINTDFAEEEKK